MHPYAKIKVRNQDFRIWDVFTTFLWSAYCTLVTTHARPGLTAFSPSEGFQNARITQPLPANQYLSPAMLFTI